MDVPDGGEGVEHDSVQLASGVAKKQIPRSTEGGAMLEQMLLTALEE